MKRYRELLNGGLTEHPDGEWVRADDADFALKRLAEHERQWALKAQKLASDLSVCGLAHQQAMLERDVLKKAGADTLKGMMDVLAQTATQHTKAAAVAVSLEKHTATADRFIGTFTAACGFWLGAGMVYMFMAIELPAPWVGMALATLMAVSLPAILWYRSSRALRNSLNQPQAASCPPPHAPP